MSNCYDTILDNLLRASSSDSLAASTHYLFAIHDDYDYWARNRRSDQSGKLLLVDPAESSPPVIQVVSLSLLDCLEMLSSEWSH